MYVDADSNPSLGSNRGTQNVKLTMLAGKSQYYPSYIEF